MSQTSVHPTREQFIIIIIIIIIIIKEPSIKRAENKIKLKRAESKKLTLIIPNC